VSKVKFFRNPEVKRNVTFYLIIGVLSACIGYMLDIKFMLFSLALSTFYTLTFLIITYNRYKTIASMCRDLDSILHGEDVINFEDYEEGELSILTNELSKMTIRLREQSDALQKEKIFLADSIADISHQIRTPLTSINLIVTFLREENLSYEKRRKLTQELMSLLSHIDWLISALLKISKLDAGTANFRSAPVSVEKLISNAAMPLEILMELKEQQLILDITPGINYTGDISWSVEAITNILKNCMEHTPVGGCLKVFARENGIYTEIIISDNGPGISKEDLPHLFERFYKGQNSSENSVGIGLALARMIIAEQNGTIKAENIYSKDNKQQSGAMFSVKFYKGNI